MQKQQQHKWRDGSTSKHSIEWQYSGQSALIITITTGWSRGCLARPPGHLLIPFRIHRDATGRTSLGPWLHTSKLQNAYSRRGCCSTVEKGWEAQDVKNRHASFCPSRLYVPQCLPGAIANAAPGTHMPAQLAMKVRRQLGFASCGVISYGSNSSSFSVFAHSRSSLENIMSDGARCVAHFSATFKRQKAVDDVCVCDVQKRWMATSRVSNTLQPKNSPLWHILRLLRLR